MRRLIILTGTLLLLSFISYGLDPPAMLWEKWYYTNHDGCHFRDMEMTDDGNLFITGSAWDWTQPILEYYCAFLLDQDGNIIWEVEQPWYVGKGNDGVVLPDSTFVITGRCVETPDSTYSLFLTKISQEGSIEWTRIYDYSETREEGYGITCLPDGGFAVCGRVHGTGSTAGQAWLLRTDAQGDTLWTRTWGTYNTSYGKSIICMNDMLCMLTMGADDTLQTGGTHLLFYDLDGNYLYGSDYPNLDYYFPGDLCPASDGGVTFVTKTLPVIWHTNQYGETLWWHNIPTGPLDSHEGFSIRQTMDSGYIFAGWTGWWQWPHDEQNAPVLEVDTGSTQEAWLVRYSEEGEYLWGIEEERGVDYHFYSAVQLPQGGYVACGTWGGSGYIARYAPETGISSPDPLNSISLEVSPNPCSSVLSVSFLLFEANHASVRVYDLGGRLVSTVADGEFPQGSNTVEWAVPEDLSSGCYFIQYNSDIGSATQSIVLIK